MVHQTHLDRARKRDRKPASIPYGVNPTGAHVALVGAVIPPTALASPKVISFNMYDSYQPWVLQTYGDQAKTKTITKNKYQRILQYLRGDYIDNENSKFKMWVKGRGFRIGPPAGFYQHCPPGECEVPAVPGIDYNPDKDPSPDIYVQTGTIKDSEGNDRVCFKKVAIVEDFFDIIYNLHVCKEGKEHKHMGQKRTYRAVSERYAFVPREAVTKFLVLCTECPRRSSATPASLKNSTNLSQVVSTSTGKVSPTTVISSVDFTSFSSSSTVVSSSTTPIKTPQNITTPKKSKTKSNFSVVSLVGSGCDSTDPVTPPAAMRIAKNGSVTLSSDADAASKIPSAVFAPLSSPNSLFNSIAVTPPSSGLFRAPAKPVKREHPDESYEKDSSRPRTRVPILNLGAKRIKKEETPDYSKVISALSSKVDYSLPITTLYMNHVKKVKSEESLKYGLNNNLCKENATADSDGGTDDELKNSAPPEKRPDQRSDWTAYSQASPKNCQEQPLSLSKSDNSRMSPCVSPVVANPGTPVESNPEETCSNGNKDEEDDEAEDDNDDDKIDAQYDPERLKAFNMFVRLFVDENLDRIVPISKQPKEKIQAIIDACSRQFPEFSERTRKRIRTYLKSCRRNKRTREPGVWENARPTPPHLTSIQAEQILATACDNESENAKRMRRGLDPVSQPNPLIPQPSITQAQAVTSDRSSSLFETAPLVKSETVANATNGNKTLERGLVNGATTIYQTGFPQTFPKGGGTLHTQPSVSMLLPTSVTGSSASSLSPGTTGGTCQVLSNGPTDLSLKGGATTKGLPRPSLNPVEVAAVRQLITGYRESAAFLLRSAEELENLLSHQTNT